ncbi:MAG: Na(+)-translocating NADH-quinone reductase subunit F [Flavobacteriaceae bacterium]
MANTLTEQELHNLAMNIVGKDLEEQGFEFLAVNSKFKKDPQFVVLKEKILHFVVVRAVTYPDAVQEYDNKLMKKMKDHAEKFEARTYFAGVGLGRGDDYKEAIVKDEEYTVIYNGLQEI